MRLRRRPAVMPLALLGLAGTLLLGSWWLRRESRNSCSAFNMGLGWILPSDKAAAAKSSSCSICHHSAHGAVGRSVLSLAASWWRGLAAGLLRDSLNEGTFSAELVGGHKALGGDSCSLCHMKSRTSAAKSLWNPSGSSSFGPPSGGDLPGTAVCMSCHDGTLAGASGFSTGPQASSRLDLSASHPIGMSYAGAAAAHPGAYHPAEGSLGIRLENGLVGCLSCHRLHGPADMNSRPTVIETACESCHRR